MTTAQFLLSAVILFVIAIVGIVLFPHRLAIEEALHIQPAIVPEAHFLFVGDMMFDRSLRAAAQKKGYDYLFSCVGERFKQYDSVIGNLEGPITSTSSKSMGSVVDTPDNYTFTFAPEVAPLLKRHNVQIVNIGNNHIFNFKQDGVNQTKQYLRNAGVTYFGDPDSLEPDRVARAEIGGIKFSFVNWSDWTSDNTDITGNQIKKEVNDGRTVVVYAHWGEEYVPATERMKKLAHQFVDDGAAIVIGSHPHVVQEHEVYNGKHIYYSLGNFIFDQYWNDAVSHGLTLDVIFNSNEVIVKELPVVLNRDRRTCFEQ